MHPVLFNIGDLHVYGYGFMIAVGVIVAILVADIRAKRRDMDGDLVFEVALWGLFTGLIGAKLAYVISNWRMLSFNPKAVLGSEGFIVYGGVLVGIIVGVIVLKHSKVKVTPYIDLMITELPLAQGFGRIGCFLAGCCYGKPTDAWFGVTFPFEAVAPDGIPLIPTQLISAAGDFLLFFLLLMLSDFITERLRPLTITGLYLILYGIGRFFVEYLRMDPRRVYFGLTSNQWVSIAFVVIGIVLIIIRNRKLREQKAENQKTEIETI